MFRKVVQISFALILLVLCFPLSKTHANPVINEFDSLGNTPISNFVFTSKNELVYLAISPSSESRLVTFNTTTKSSTERLIEPVNQGFNSFTLAHLAIDNEDNVWFASAEDNSGPTQSYIRKVSPSGDLTNYPYSIPDLEPGCPQSIIGLTFTPGGQLWGYGGDINTCDSQYSGLIIKVDPNTGAVTNQYRIEDTGLVFRAKADGENRLLFSTVDFQNSSKILGSINSDGSYQLYSNTKGASVGNSFIKGPDGNMWGAFFNEVSGSSTVSYFAKVDSTGSVSEFEAPLIFFSNLVVAGDNNIWFGGLNQIGKLNADGSYLAYPIDSQLYVTYLDKDKGGNLWGTAFDPANNKVKIIYVDLGVSTNTNNIITQVKAPKSGNLAVIFLVTSLLVATLVGLGIGHNRKLVNKRTSSK